MFGQFDVDGSVVWKRFRREAGIRCWMGAFARYAHALNWSDVCRGCR